MRVIRALLAILIATGLAACGASAPDGPQPQADVAPMAAPTNKPSVSRLARTDAAVEPEYPVQRSAFVVHQTMLNLAEAGDWGTFVDRYYGESEDFRSREDRDGLVDRLEGEWGERMLESLRNARGLSPIIDSDGRAVFLDNGVPVFVLHKHEDGRWTFRL